MRASTWPVRLVLVLGLALLTGLPASVSQTSQVSETAWEVLYQEDFESGQAQGWRLDSGWDVVPDSAGNRVLRGRGHSWAVYTDEDLADFTLTLRLKIVRGQIQVNVRTAGCLRYIIALDREIVVLRKSSSCHTHLELRSRERYHSAGRWYEVKIVGQGSKIEVHVDGWQILSFTDPSPLLFGGIALETLDDSEFHIDDVTVLGRRPPTYGLVWTRTGGPPGGIGYDIRVRPGNSDVMYVTDALAGVHRSSDGGMTWLPMNEGISARVGTSGDGIPVFCLTIDPNNPNTVWIGLQGVRGIYRSTDGGHTWEERVQGIVEDHGLTIRGITVEPGNSSVVYAAGEISSQWWARQGIQGQEFDLVKGVVYRSTDAGLNWTAIWRGDNLARYVLIDPTDARVIYVSTGIFDREAANSDPRTKDPGGEGVLKTVDGGVTWFRVNTGLRNLYIGSMAMHPQNPAVLMAGAGNVTYSTGEGVYLTTDGGRSWRLVAPGRITSVEFASDQGDIAYAAGDSAFYRSRDGGRTWQLLAGAGGKWGAPAMRPGLAIDIQADPRDPLRVFVNNYGGGNFLSFDGGATWRSASDGYTGADLTDVAVSLGSPDYVYANGRNGPFRSTTGGIAWMGMNPGGDALPLIDEGARVAVDPHNPACILVSSTQWGWVYLSKDRGLTWNIVINAHDELQRLSKLSDARQRFQGMWAIAFAPSRPGRVYGGWGQWRCSTDAHEEECALRTMASIFVSDDGGRTWVRRTTALDGLTVASIVVHPFDADVAWAATVGGGVFCTVDGGVTWTPTSNGITDKRVMALAVDPTNPDLLYAGTAGAALFKSTDGGRTWRPSSAGMNPTEFITSIAVDPVVPTTMYAGSASSGVFVSNNGGGWWVRVNRGLRVRAVSALAISSDGGTLYAATRGEGVFRLDLGDRRDEE